MLCVLAWAAPFSSISLLSKEVQESKQISIYNDGRARSGCFNRGLISLARLQDGDRNTIQVGC
jgi:hypothetical protein